MRNIRSDRISFSHIVDVKDAPLPVLRGEVIVSSSEQYADLLANYVRPYLDSQFPFKTKLTWSIKITGGNAPNKLFYRASPPFTFMSTGNRGALMQYVANIMREWEVTLEYIEGSGWSVEASPNLRIALTHLQEGQV